MRYPAHEADAAAALLRRLAGHLAALTAIADTAHRVISDEGLIPDASGCLPDLLADLIGTVEAQARELEAEIGLRAAA
jgi:hypothetical protein